MTDVVIWGSCVSRDTFEYLPEDFTLKAYVARQSWISAGNAATLPESSAMESDFQRQMADGDCAGDALDQLERFRTADVVLLDLIDERLGVVESASGGVSTRSVDRMNVGQQELIDAEGLLLEFGSDEHFARWSESADMVTQFLKDSDLFDRTLVLAPAWAFFDELAEPLPSSFGKTALEMNQVFDRYYAYLSTAGYRLARIESTLGASDHKWGRAPFHYHDSIYEALVEAIRRELKS